MKYDKDPSRSSSNTRRAGKLLAATAPLLLAAACSFGKGEGQSDATKVTHPPAATAKPFPTTSTSRPETTTTTGSIEQQVVEAQKSMNTKVDKLLKGSWKDLPEKIAAFHDNHDMTFHQYPYPLDQPGGESYQAILSQSRGEEKGSTETKYSMFIIYKDKPDGSRDFDYVDIFSLDYADPSTMDDPELQGFQILNQVKLFRTENGDWIPGIIDKERGWDTSAGPATALAPERFDQEVAVFTDLFNQAT